MEFVAKEFVLDMQGFKASSNEFIFKEVALAELGEEVTPSVFLFKPPYPWEWLPAKNRAENCWLEKNFHGISWAAGDLPYDELGRTLRAELFGAIVYVKGLEKAKWLRSLLVNANAKVFNVEDLGCPSLKNFPYESHITCNNHSKQLSNPACAWRNVFTIATWLLNRRYNNLHTRN